MRYRLSVDYSLFCSGRRSGSSRVGLGNLPFPSRAAVQCGLARSAGEPVEHGGDHVEYLPLAMARQCSDLVEEPLGFSDRAGATC